MFEIQIPGVSNTIVLLVILIGVFYWNTFGYWKRRNVFSPPRKSIFTGHFTVNEKAISSQLADYHLSDKNEPFVGLYLTIIKLLLVKDLDLVRNVLTKDYSHFEGHGVKASKEIDPLASNLFNLEKEEWKRMRVKLTPTFTSSKMKYMFDTILKCNQEMVEHLREMIKEDNVIEMKDITAKLSINVIASCGFGIDSNCFKNPDSEFRRLGLKCFDTNIFQAITWTISMFAPKFAEMSRMRITFKDVEEFMLSTVEQTIEYREKNHVQRNDFLQLLLDMRNADRYTGTQLTIKEIAAQVFVFFLAGFETSSTATQYALLELAKNPELIEELEREIDRAVEENDDKLTYELLKKIPLLDEVIDETLRMYPPVPFLTRRCTKDYLIPGTDILIEEGTGVSVSVLGIHNDPELYPEPEKFKPERFNAENKNSRHPYAYIPFGDGPRNCIGSRFGKMALKLAIIHILRNFKVELSPKTPLPVKFNPTALLLHCLGGIYLKLTPRN